MFGAFDRETGFKHNLHCGTVGIHDADIETLSCSQELVFGDALHMPPKLLQLFQENSRKIYKIFAS